MTTSKTTTKRRTKAATIKVKPMTEAKAMGLRRRRKPKALAGLPTGDDLQAALGGVAPTNRMRAIEAMLRELLGRACQALGVSAEDLRAFKPKAFNHRAIALGLYIDVARSIQRADAVKRDGVLVRAQGVPWRPLIGPEVVMTEFRKHLHYSALFGHRKMLHAHLAMDPPNDFTAMLASVRARLFASAQAAWTLIEQRFPVPDQVLWEETEDDAAVDVEVVKASNTPRARPERRVRAKTGPRAEKSGRGSRWAAVTKRAAKAVAAQAAAQPPAMPTAAVLPPTISPAPRPEVVAVQTSLPLPVVPATMPPDPQPNADAADSVKARYEATAEEATANTSDAA